MDEVKGGTTGTDRCVSEAVRLRASFNMSVAFARATHDPASDFDAFAEVLYDHLEYLHGWRAEDLAQPAVRRP
jgi:hypothetical protein